MFLLYFLQRCGPALVMFSLPESRGTGPGRLPAEGMWANSPVKRLEVCNGRPTRAAAMTVSDAR